MMDHIPKIIIRSIASDDHRYPTCGDYIFDKDADTLTIYVSKMGDWRSELAVAIHEMVESVSCLASDVDLMEIDRFDFQFEKDRIDGKYSKTEEPGDNKLAPYHEQHVAATLVEKSACDAVRIDWQNHEENVNLA